MNYGTIDLNNPLNKINFMNDFNEYLRKKNKTKLTRTYISESLNNQSIQSLKNSLLHLNLSIKGKKLVLIKRLEKDITELMKSYDL